MIEIQRDGLRRFALQARGIKRSATASRTRRVEKNPGIIKKSDRNTLKRNVIIPIRYLSPRIDSRQPDEANITPPLSFPRTY